MDPLEITFTWFSVVWHDAIQILNYEFKEIILWKFSVWKVVPWLSEYNVTFTYGDGMRDKEKLFLRRQKTNSIYSVHVNYKIQNKGMLPLHMVMVWETKRNRGQ